MSTIEEIKAATGRLDPNEQYELFQWWVKTDVFKQRQLSALKRDIAEGVTQLESGRYRTYEDHDVMRLADEVRESGRNKLGK